MSQFFVEKTCFFLSKTCFSDKKNWLLSIKQLNKKRQPLVADFIDGEYFSVVVHNSGMILL
jgi:hypothetical protein